jgi:hypothetical protein
MPALVKAMLPVEWACILQACTLQLVSMAGLAGPAVVDSGVVSNDRYGSSLLTLESGVWSSVSGWHFYLAFGPGESCLWSPGIAVAAPGLLRVRQCGMVTEVQTFV